MRGKIARLRAWNRAISRAKKPVVRAKAATNPQISLSRLLPRREYAQTHPQMTNRLENHAGTRGALCQYAERHRAHARGGSGEFERGVHRQPHPPNGLVLWARLHSLMVHA
jgi:hypothetical protein